MRKEVIMMKQDILHFRGCLLGGAIGDATESEVDKTADQIDLP
jgi:hypothetical protein